MDNKGYIDRGVLLEFLRNTYDIPLDTWMARNYWTKEVEIKQKFIDCIEEIPSADVVGVVRCGSCKHAKMFVDMIGDPHLYCSMWGKPTKVDFDDFCSKGERG